jgi:hypothetical protein
MFFYSIVAAQGLRCLMPIYKKTSPKPKASKMPKLALAAMPEVTNRAILPAWGYESGYFVILP